MKKINSPCLIERTSKQGFTLIEIAVATTILVIVVLVLAQIFHQSSLAWTSGMRKANGNMTGRTAMSLMARELMNAAADSNVLNEVEFKNGQSKMKFPSFVEQNKVGTRVVQLVNYEISGDKLLRSFARIKDSGPYGAWDALGGETILVTNAVSFQVYTPQARDYTDGLLPEWVRLELIIKRDSDVSRIGAVSPGRDRRMGTDDDIRSY